MSRDDGGRFLQGGAKVAFTKYEPVSRPFFTAPTSKSRWTVRCAWKAIIASLN